MRQAHQLRQHHAGLAVAQIVGLQAGQDQIRIFRARLGGQQPGDAQRVESREVSVFDVDGAIRAFGQSFADGLLRARRGRRRWPPLRRRAFP